MIPLIINAKAAQVKKISMALSMKFTTSVQSAVALINKE
jgi:hypothetical protein